MRAPFEVAGRVVDETRPPFVIAEISANHGSSKTAALELIHAAADAGVDAVKFQHYTPDTITVRSEHPDFRVGGGTIWDGRTLYDLYAEAMTPWEWTPDLAAAAESAGVVWFSTPFDATAIDFLADCDVPIFKIASFELVDLPLIRLAAAKGKPLLMSTGMASIAEIDAAVRAADEGGAPSVALLRCNSGYPADPAEMDLRAIPAMREIWQVPIGLSDHTLSITATIAAIALGACIIEKHITMRRADGGPDAAFSLEPAEFAQLVRAAHDAHAALGVVRFGPSPREVASTAFRRSLRAVRDIRAGDRITDDNVRSVRPAGGLPPDDAGVLAGMVAAHDLSAGDPITWQDVRPAGSTS